MDTRWKTGRLFVRCFRFRKIQLFGISDNRLLCMIIFTRIVEWCSNPASWPYHSFANTYCGRDRLSRVKAARFLRASRAGLPVNCDHAFFRLFDVPFLLSKFPPTLSLAIRLYRQVRSERPGMPFCQLCRFIRRRERTGGTMQAQFVGDGRLALCRAAAPNFLGSTRATAVTADTHTPLQWGQPFPLQIFDQRHPKRLTYLIMTGQWLGMVGKFSFLTARQRVFTGHNSYARSPSMYDDGLNDAVGPNRLTAQFFDDVHRQRRSAVGKRFGTICSTGIS